MMKVRVYFNLHRKLFSVMDCATRRVIGHRRTVNLSGARFVVSEPGRQRVIREKRKNVHAFVEGTLVEAVPPTRTWRRVSYNPYFAGHFYCPDTPERVRVGASDAVSMYAAANGKPSMYAAV